MFHFTCAHVYATHTVWRRGRAMDRHKGDIHSVLQVAVWGDKSQSESELGRLWRSNDHPETPGASPGAGEASCSGPCLPMVMGREAREAQGPRPQGDCPRTLRNKYVCSPHLPAVHTIIRDTSLYLTTSLGNPSQPTSVQFLIHSCTQARICSTYRTDCRAQTLSVNPPVSSLTACLRRQRRCLLGQSAQPWEGRKRERSLLYSGFI